MSITPIFRMKIISVCIVFMTSFVCLYNYGSAQNELGIIVYDNFTEPQFDGGLDSLHQFLIRNTVYPDTSIVMGESGRVIVQFIVEKDETISEVEIIRGVSKFIDEEVLRVMRLMPAWIPAIKNGIPVRAVARMPINFTPK